MEQFDYPQAETAFREAIELSPEWLSPKINLGIALLNQPENVLGKLPQAIKIFTEILEEEPDNPYAHYCLGIIFEYEGKTDLAFEHFKKVTEIDANDEYAWYHLGNAWQVFSQLNEHDAPEKAAGQLREARQCFDRAYRLNPYFAAAIFQLGMMSREEDLNKSKALLQEHTDLTAKMWDEGQKKASRYSEMGKYAEVIGGERKWRETRSDSSLPLFARDEQLQVKLTPVLAGRRLPTWAMGLQAASASACANASAP